MKIRAVSPEKLPTLTTTSYAILGFLNRRPMSAYDLTNVMQNSLAGTFWPRTRSKLFDEPKKLAAHGYATVERETTGRRRSVYTVTKAGRQALAEWIRQPTQITSVESEMALKVLAARTAEPEDIVTMLREQKVLARERMKANEPVMASWREGTGRFPDDAHLSALGIALMLNIQTAIHDWIDWTTEIIGTWDDTQASEEKTAWARDVYQMIDRHMQSIQTTPLSEQNKIKPLRSSDLPRPKSR